MFIKVLTVTEITSYIKRILSADAILKSVSIKGEISNFKYHYSGHMYFTLKDDNSRIKCVMFKSSCANLKFMPEDGMNVIVSGSVSLYERDGQYQLYCDEMQPDGIGALFMAYEQLKTKLEKEGLFDKTNKIPIPKYPSKIGVVTSSTGAAIKDIINITTRRYPGIEILIVPVLVQGTEAAYEIANAIELLNKRNDIDVIIIGRGGGSIEELWAFNEEVVARAIYKSKIPIISAVGHETDFTIADFVADLRAPTPSAAAELCVPDKGEINYRINACCGSLKSFIDSSLNVKGNHLEQLSNILGSLNPSSLINQKRQYIDSLNHNMITSLSHRIDINKEILKKFSTNLQNLSPLSIISRGYSITYINDTKNIVKDASKINCGDLINVMLSNGDLKCTVTNIKMGGFNIEEDK